MRNINSRSLSVFLSSTALLCPIVLYFFGFYDPPETDKYVCGLYILGPILFTVVLVFLLSSTGLTFGLYSFKKIQAPKSLLRKFELIYLFVPWLLVLAYVGTFILFDFGIIN